MEIEIIRPAQLTTEDISQWRAIQAESALESPFFAPEFALAMAVARDDVFIARIKPIAFFAFHRAEDGIHPIGCGISDFHGLIAPEPAPFSPQALLKACQVNEFRFRCIPESQTFFQPGKTSELKTLRIELQAPFGSNRIGDLQRRAERQIGPLRFTWRSPAPRDLQILLRCKSAQYQRTGLADTTGEPWVAATLHALNQGSLGLLSLLHAGDQLLAAHFGIRSATVLHYWFPCYATQFARYSPGLMLLKAIADRAPREGVNRIDLGFAQPGYKTRFANAGGSVYRGCITNL